MLTELAMAAAFGFFGSLGLVVAARRWARRVMVLDHPNERSLHQQPTPRGGGIGIVIPVCLVLVVLGVAVPADRIAAAWLAGLALLIAAIGLADDIRGLPAGAKFVAHISAATVLALALGPCRHIAWPALGRLDAGVAALPLTMLWVVGLTNAYNFMDGIDGLAGSQGLVAGLGWVGAGYVVQSPFVALAGAVIASTNLGFLFFNWSPASIFMGDVASGFLGFMLAALAVCVAPRSPEGVAAGVLFVWPFVFDATFTFFRRLTRGENVFAAHRGHLYQRLVLAGMSHRNVTVLYAALAAVGAVVGIAGVSGAEAASTAGLVLITLLAVGLWLGVALRERAAIPPASAPRGRLAS